MTVIRAPTTQLWLWLLLVSAAWTAGYSASAIVAGQTPPLTAAAGQHALFAIGAGGAGPLAAIQAAAGTAGEFRHRTAAATFLAAPRRARVIAAKLITGLAAGAGYALACVAVSLTVALPWLAARGTPVSATGHGNLPVLGAVIVSVAVFGVTGTGLGALLGSEVIAVAGLLLYLYIAGPLLSRIAAAGSWTAWLPGVAADALTQASQPGVRLLPPLAGRPGVRRLGWAHRVRRRCHDRRDIT